MLEAFCYPGLPDAKPISLRMALGASRPHIIRQLLTESLFAGPCGWGYRDHSFQLGRHLIIASCSARYVRDTRPDLSGSVFYLSCFGYRGNFYSVTAGDPCKQN